MPAWQYVYVMKDLTKSYPGGREVFKGITLSFLPDAKIGVLGPNGAGKSTLMRIMAGLDTEFGGEAWAAEGARVGYLPQEPKLDPDKTVGQNVVEAFGELTAQIRRFNEISDKFAEPMEEEEMNALLAEQAELQAKIEAADGWGAGPPGSDRARRAALPALRQPRHAPLGRRAAARRALQAAAGKPDLLLLDEPTNHLDAESVSWLEKTLRSGRARCWS
jgi:ATPase subunit of ABC transporter with duplicated ATPase domains